MAKPARAKKKQTTDMPAKKGEKKLVEKAAAKGKAKEAKTKEAKGGLKSGLLAKAQSAKVAKPSKGAAAKEKRSVTKFLREVRSEMSKVTWPTREELIQSTIVVVIAVAIAGVYIAVFDAIFSRFISWLS